MAGIALVGIDSAGGTHLGGGQNVLYIDGVAAVVVGDPVANHGSGSNRHTGVTMVTGSSVLFIDGKAVCRAGDLASCGHSSTGQDWFNID